MTAAQEWAAGLAQWALPAEILDAAPLTPFVFTPEMFAAPEPGTFEPSQSTLRAAEALPPGGSVLDVGCGGGAAAFALLPAAGELFGTDRQHDMTELFMATAAQRGVKASVYPGLWPDIADDVPVADVVVSNNVLYNVPKIVDFALAMDRHARHRVVIEITRNHPQTVRKPLWKHFWNLDRPDVPTSDIAAAALREGGLAVHVEQTVGTARNATRAAPVDAAFWCRMLCLPPERESEVAEQLVGIGFPTERATIWWDTER
jgi:SAM-dependent methyltransferase